MLSLWIPIWLRALLLAFAFHAASAHAAQLDIPGPSGSGAFGTQVTVLPNGNFVVTDPSFDAPGPVADVGAVYLYSPTGTLISTLTGSLASDRVGSGGVRVLANGHYVIRSPAWNGSRGAVTWGSASIGVSGTVSVSNSLVGGTADDNVGGNDVTALSNGNYVVVSSFWNATGPAVIDVGAVTWGNGTGGTVGLVSAANSLIGASENDYVGFHGVTSLSNGHYVVASAGWDATGPVPDVGAVTWGNGTGGTVGLVSAANSLVGGSTGDNVGLAVTALGNGHYVVASQNWDATGPAVVDVGAVTWGNGTGGTVGPVSAANSLVGGSASDFVGLGITALGNGNYVVASKNWDAAGPAVSDVGAVTWGNGTGGTVGLISAANSLVGGSASDFVGTAVIALGNGNYVVISQLWDATGPAVVDVGAVTWGNGTGGTVGPVSAANSLVGGSASDFVGSNGVVALSNGNYVVGSAAWDAAGPAVSDVGAVTWGNGTGGTVGLVSAANSLVGGTTDDQIGSNGVVALSNGNYVVGSQNWDATGPAVVDVGAVTWGNGTGGTAGPVSAANSLVGGSASDFVGRNDVTALSNGNYVVGSAAWDAPGPAVSDVGAVTWGNGTVGTVGLVSAANSLVGGTTDDQIGSNGVIALSNGHYVVHSSSWDASALLTNVGAATWGNGAGGTVGLVSASNSLVGGSANDRVGDFGSVTALNNGNYVVRSPTWDGPGPTTNSGAISRGLGSGGTVGSITTANSVLGTAATGGANLVFTYDVDREHLIVGRPGDNIVTIFSDLAAPTVTTLPAGPVDATSATLNATVDPNGVSTTVSFEWGLTVAYGNTVAATPSPLTGAGAQSVSAVISGLTPGSTYHFRVTATNTEGTTVGLNQSFVAQAAGLQVGSVTLPATVAALGNAATRVRFAQAFNATPVVIVQASNDNPDPQALRVTNITSSGFDLLQVESPGGTCNSCDARGPAMTVHWLAALPGSYRIPDDALSHPVLPPSMLRGAGPGVLLKVGTVSTNAHQRNTGIGGFSGWPAVASTAVSFPAGEAFTSSPVVLSTLQSWNQANEGFNLNLFGPLPTLRGTSAPWATVVTTNVTTSGFDVAIEASEVDDDDQDGTGFAAAETIGYVAFDSNVSARLTPLGGGALVGLATGLSTANDSCSDTDLNFLSGVPISASNLRGFAGKQSRNEADGGWLRRCAMSTPGGTVVRTAMRVDEDADLDAERTHGSETIGTAIFGGDFVTTPVSLAHAELLRVGEGLQLRFSSATEVGHLGYRVWGRSGPMDTWRLLTPELLLNRSGDGFAGKDYQLSLPARLPASDSGAAPGAELMEVRLEDVDVHGHSRFHPPLAVGSSVGSAPIAAALDWTAITAANRSTPVRSLRGSQALALLDVSKDGIYRVRFEDLQAHGFVAGTPAQSVALLDDGQPVARQVSCTTLGAGCLIEFVGQRRQSLYGASNVYTLKLDAAAARPVASGGLAATANRTRSYLDSVIAEPNRAYSFAAPVSDPWYDERLVAGSSPASLSRSFSLPGRVADAPARLRMQLWGGTDFAGDAPDHSVVLELNGQTVATRRFDGLVLETIDVMLPAALLQASNTLTLRVPGDTGYSADVVLLDGYRVDYSRETLAVQGVLDLGTLPEGVGSGETVFASGFETSAPDGVLLRGVSGASVLWTDINGVPHRATLSADQAIDARFSTLRLRPLSSIETLQPRAGVDAGLDTSPVDYLIVTHPLFEGELAALVALQQARGLSVRILRSDQIYAAYSDHALDPAAIQDAIARINPRFVLLVGGDSYDYHDYLGIGSQSFVPTWYRGADAVVRFAPTDHLYVDQNRDGLPERAIGRIPARSVAELRLAVDSITSRGNQISRRTVAVAGRSSGSEQFAIHSRSLLSYLRQGQDTGFALADEIGTSAARSQASAALAGGADWINYLGHSSPNRWAFDNLLDTSQLATITRSGTPAIVSQWGCWNNYFVLPTQDTMAHALMLRSNRLAAAVIGSTSLADDASHLALGTRFFDLVEDGRIRDDSPLQIRTTGEALMEAKRELLRQAPEFSEAAYSITLFGDPAAPLR